jgi:hypothetical protein
VKHCKGAHNSVGSAALTLTDETLLVRSLTCYFIKLYFQDFSGLWGAYSVQIHLRVAFLKGCNILKLVMEELLVKITTTNISIQFSQRNYNTVIIFAAPLSPNIPVYPSIGNADNYCTGTIKLKLCDSEDVGNILRRNVRNYQQCKFS